MTPDVLRWDGASNNRFMLTGEGCLHDGQPVDPRAAESMKLDFAGELRLAAMPAGPASRPRLLRLLHLFDLEVRRESGRCQAVPGRLCRPVEGCLPRKRLPEHAVLPGDDTRTLKLTEASRTGRRQSTG